MDDDRERGGQRVNPDLPPDRPAPAGDLGDDKAASIPEQRKQLAWQPDSVSDDESRDGEPDGGDEDDDGFEPL